MHLFNIGPMELLLALVLMFILLGPEGMVKSARTIGGAIRRLVRSPIWTDIQKTKKDIENLPVQLVREAGFEETAQEIRASTRVDLSGSSLSSEDAPKTIKPRVETTFSNPERAPRPINAPPPPASVPPTQPATASIVTGDENHDTPGDSSPR